MGRHIQIYGMQGRVTFIDWENVRFDMNDNIYIDDSYVD